MKKAIKVFSWFALMIVLLLTVFLLWVKNSWKEIYTEKELQNTILKINSSKPLPEDFRETLSLVYPGIFDNNFNQHAVDRIITDKDYQPCPCRQVAVMFTHRLPHSNRFKWSFYPVSITWKFEEELTQEECFSFYLERFDFTRGIKGIENASLAYFGNELGALTLDQQLELILKIENPVLYNKKRFPEKFNAELKKLQRKVSELRN